jgi:hypothetical protein
MNTFMPALYIHNKGNPYTLLEDGTRFEDESDKRSLYFVAKNAWLENTWLKFEERYFMVWTGCHGHIKALDSFVPEGDLLEELREKGLVFYLYEPLSTYRLNIENEFIDHRFYDQYETTTLSKDCMRSFELDSIQEFAKKYNIQTITVYTCDYNIVKYYQKHYYHITLKCQDIFVAADCVSDAVIEPYKTKKVHKKFWCGNWRYNGLRHLVMMYLASTNSFYNGNYSWYVYGGRGYLNRKLWFDLSAWEYTHPALAGKIELGEKKLNDLVPLSMDIQEPPMYWVGDKYRKNPPTVNSYRLPLHYSECFVAIVNETRFAQPTANFSEKILNTVRAFRPFVLFAPPKTLEYFRLLGFKTFGDFWDESYDYCENHEQRLMKIFKVIDYIDSLSLNETRDILAKMAPILEHNAINIRNVPLQGISFD